MIISRDYMLEEGHAHSAAKRFFDARVVPVAVNAAGGLDAALDRAARRTSLRPSLRLTGVAGLASLHLIGLLRLARPAPAPF